MFSKRTNTLLPNDIDFSPTKVCSTLLNLNKGASAGPDGIPADFLIKLRHELCTPLSHIFKCSYSSGVLPDDWLHAIVSPIFKKR